MYEPLLSLAAHVVAMILIAVPLLWATWRQHGHGGEFRPWPNAAKVALFAVIAWLVAYGIQTLVRETFPNGTIGSLYPSKRRLSHYPLVDRKSDRDTPYPTPEAFPIRVSGPGD